MPASHNLVLHWVEIPAAGLPAIRVQNLGNNKCLDENPGAGALIIKEKNMDWPGLSIPEESPHGYLNPEP